MSTLEEVKAKLESGEKLEQELSKSFNNVYSCTRVWSAWSYDTMTVDDFAPFEKGDEAFDEFSTNFKAALLLEKIDNKDKFYDFIEKQVGVYELFYNDDLNDFHSQAFSEDFLGSLDFDDVYPAVQKYQETHLPKVEVAAVKPLKPKM